MSVAATHGASPGSEEKAPDNPWRLPGAPGRRLPERAPPWGYKEKAPGARALLKGPEPEQEGSKAGAAPINAHGAARGGQPEQREALKRPAKIELGKIIQILILILKIEQIEILSILLYK